jgi:hypothetical protein
MPDEAVRDAGKCWVTLSELYSISESGPPAYRDAGTPRWRILVKIPALLYGF